MSGAVVVDGGWTEAIDIALAHPEATVVTKQGDRFGGNGWRIGVAGAGATGAALEEAHQKVSDTAAEVEVCKRRLLEARSALEEAKRAEGELARKLAGAVENRDRPPSAVVDGRQQV